MKKIFKTFTASVAAAVILMSNATAQSAIAMLSEKWGTDFSTYSVVNTAGEGKNENSLSDINPRAIKDFQKSFKGITNEKWSKLNDGYVASFTADSIRTMVAYNSKGVWHHTIRSYDEKKLPRNVRNMVKSVYYDYTILNVAEIYLDNEPVYIVYMQDETHLKTIGIYDGEIQEVQNYKRV